MEKKIGDENSGESRQLATNRLKEKLIWKIINNRMNLINSTSAASPVFLFSPLVVQKLNMNALTYCSKVKCWKCAVWRISPSCNTSWSVLPLHIFFAACNMSWSVLPFTFVCFWRLNFFYGDHFAIKGCQKATFWKSELGVLIHCNYTYHCFRVLLQIDKAITLVTQLSFNKSLLPNKHTCQVTVSYIF